MENSKRTIAIVCGGDSSEHDVSLRSGQGLYSFFDKERYNIYIVDVKGQDWHVNLPNGTTAPIDKNDFSFVLDGKAVVFDYAYITIHGTPGENGVMQGYFELLHIPYSTSGVLVEAMTFDKYVLNNYLRGWGVNVAKSILVRRGEESRYSDEFIEKEIGMPCFVKPAADGPDYREKFLREIAPKLDTDNAFVADAAPYTEQQLQFEVMNGDTDKVNSQAVVVLFLLVNVFLGLIGTFWFRTRRRRSEIALRMAMGSTRGGVFRLLIGEGLLLLALVTLPAMVVCYNVGMAEFTIGRTSLISTWPIEWSVIRFLAGSLGAWLLIALMVVIGIWFPARQAMKIEPAEALHEE